MTDGTIQPGDVVEAVRDIRRRQDGGPLLEIAVPKGTRAVVRGLLSLPWLCTYCGSSDGLDVGRLRPSALCAWRKIGGSQADTVRRFAEDLAVSKPLTPAKTPEPEIA